MQSSNIFNTFRIIYKVCEGPFDQIILLCWKDTSLHVSLKCELYGAARCMEEARVVDRLCFAEHSLALSRACEEL